MHTLAPGRDNERQKHADYMFNNLHSCLPRHVWSQHVSCPVDNPLLSFNQATLYFTLTLRAWKFRGHFKGGLDLRRAVAGWLYLPSHVFLDGKYQDVYISSIDSSIYGCIYKYYSVFIDHPYYPRTPLYFIFHVVQHKMPILDRP